MLRITLAATLVALALSAPIQSSNLEDLVTDLPGLPAGATFKQYSGYIPVGPNKDRMMFYWLVESQNDPAKDPLVLWTNGGPGCSGLGGFLTEQGPFRPTANGTALEMNPYSWNKLANMVFIEQPVGVGFSYSSSGAKINYGDDQAASDNYDFIVGFLAKHAQYAHSDFYITSESYGGHYMPTLAKKLVDNGGVKTFKGFAVGNPLTWMPYRDYGQMGAFWAHQVLPKPMWDQWLENDCLKNDGSNKCNALMNQAMQLAAGLDPYALDFPVCTTQLAAGRDERMALLRAMHKAKADNTLGGYFPAHYEQCSENWAADYLNRPDVQKALHVAKPTTWALCNDDINMHYNQTDVMAPMMPVYKYLVEKSNIRIVVYSGDDDSMCSSIGSQQFIWDLGLKTVKDWAPWTVAGQVAGFTVEFDGVRFATVHGAGHMVPATRPAQALEVFRQFLAGWTD